MDRISELPDDILVCSILSLLTMREAATTSVLSNRWRHLWKYISVLSFDASTICDEDESAPGPKSKYLKLVGSDLVIRCWKVEQEFKYIHWVDKVVNSHQAFTIDEFRFMFNFSEGCLENLDSWLRFAMEKRVKRLGVGIPTHSSGEHCYNFPSLPLCNTLTSLELERVNVTDQVLEKLLIGCPALEFVSVIRSYTLVDLRVVGNVKTLIIKHCFGLTILEISAPNLKSIQYIGRIVSSPFLSCPKLVDISIGGLYGDHLISDCSDILSISSQLEVLSLKPGSRIEFIANQFPVFPRVKILHFMVSLLNTEKQLFSLRHLMNACPFLETFVLEITYCLRGTTSENITKQENEAFSHKDLKIVEIVGFCGHELGFEFAKYLSDNIISLEKLIIHLIDVEHEGETLE